MHLAVPGVYQVNDTSYQAQALSNLISLSLVAIIQEPRDRGLHIALSLFVIETTHFGQTILPSERSRNPLQPCRYLAGLAIPSSEL